MGKLFEFDYGEDNSPIDDPMITQVILFFGFDNAVALKKMCKELMKHHWPETYIEDGNISDLLFKLVKQDYDANINTEKKTDGTPSGEVKRLLFE